VVPPVIRAVIVVVVVSVARAVMLGKLRRGSGLRNPPEPSAGLARLGSDR
jgi:hypothetical protein